MRALHHGATIPTCTVNGIGERAGNAPLHTETGIHTAGITIHPAIPLVLGREDGKDAR